MSLLRSFVFKRPKLSQRILEILPGFVSWNIILFPLWGAFCVPDAVGVFVLLFYLYWLYRSMISAIRSSVAHSKIKKQLKKDPQNELEGLADSSRVRHLVIIPTYNEGAHILIRTLEALEKQTVGPKKIIPVLAFEARAGKELNSQREFVLKQRFEGVFERLIFTYHPENLKAEVVGKSSNMAWAAKELNKLIQSEKNWDTDFLTISSADADVCFHSFYFAGLTKSFLTNPDRYDLIWQGALMFYNNIDKIPMIMRAFNRLFTAVSIGSLCGKNGLINFSTYSTSWNLMQSIGFWDVDVIPEDYRIFFKAFFSTHGKTRVEPLFIPIYADAAEAKGFWNTFVNTYEQVKRWAWGTSDDAYIIKRAIIDQRIPLLLKVSRVLRVLEVHFLWPVNWFLLTCGVLVLQIFNPAFMATGFGLLIPVIAGIILTPTTFALILLIIVDLRSQPNFPNLPLWRQILYPLELFFLIPVAGLLFSALPSLDAHTRLLAGRYLEYRVTEKV